MSDNRKLAVIGFDSISLSTLREFVDRGAEGWALWDELMGWGDQIVARAYARATSGSYPRLSPVSRRRIGAPGLPGVGGWKANHGERRRRRPRRKETARTGTRTK